MAKIDYKNRSVSVVKGLDIDGQGAIEIRYDRFDGVLYMVENGEMKRIWPALKDGIISVSGQLTAQAAGYIPSPLPNDNLMTAAFTNTTTLLLTFASKIVQTSFVESNLTITPSVSILDYGFEGATSQTLQVNLASAVPYDTQYTILLKNIENIIGDVNSVTATATSPSAPSCTAWTQIQYDEGSGLVDLTATSFDNYDGEPTTEFAYWQNGIDRATFEGLAFPIQDLNGNPEPDLIYAFSSLGLNPINGSHWIIAKTGTTYYLYTVADNTYVLDVVGTTTDNCGVGAYGNLTISSFEIF